MSNLDRHAVWEKDIPLGGPGPSDDVDCIRQASYGAWRSQPTEHVQSCWYHSRLLTLFFGRAYMKPYKLQAAHKLTESDKLKSQSAKVNWA
jgi:hypothetical protein